MDAVPIGSVLSVRPSPAYYGEAEVLSVAQMQAFLPLPWGNGQIAGTVTVAGQAAVRRVRLYDDATGALRGETWSGSDGSYQFAGLDRQRKYLAIAHDHLEQYNAAVADLMVPSLPS